MISIAYEKRHLCPKPVINQVRTKSVGFAPILAHYFDKCGIVDIVDEDVSTDPNLNGRLVKTSRRGAKAWKTVCPTVKTARHQKAEYLLQKFEHVVSRIIRLPDEKNYGSVSELTELQSDILVILDLPER